MAKKQSVPSGRRPETKPDAPWRDLARRFAALVAGPPESWPSWQIIWRTLLEDPWLRQELRLQARIVLRRFRLPRDSRGDVEHDALLILAHYVHRTPDLGVDRQRIDEEFGPWMSVILRRACRQAVRTPARRQRKRAPVSPYELSVDSRRVIELRTDLSLAVEEMDEPTRSVVLLHNKGYTLVEIAELLCLPYERAKRELRAARRRLRKVLGEPS